MLLLFGLTQPQPATATAPPEASDLDLVRATRLNPAAFIALYERYLDRIFSYCYVRLQNREAAEDATSEVFLKALTGLAGFREGLFAAWLFQIAHHTVVNSQRRQKPTALYEAEAFADPGPTLEEMAVEQADRQSVRAALAQLPDEQRTVLELQCAGWSGEQIAAAIGKSGPAVRMLRHRAVERLKQIVLGQEGRLWTTTSKLSCWKGTSAA